jgi:hypothetical protein
VKKKKQEETYSASNWEERHHIVIGIDTSVDKEESWVTLMQKGENPRFKGRRQGGKEKMGRQENPEVQVA